MAAGNIILDAQGKRLLNSLGQVLLDDGTSAKGCCYYQARRCSDGVLAGFYLNITQIPSFPYYFKYDPGTGVQCYYVLSTDKNFCVPNATGITTISSCTGDTVCGGGGGCTVTGCPDGGGVNTPQTAKVTFANVQLCSTGCTQCQNGGVPGNGSLNVTSATLNGTYCLSCDRSGVYGTVATWVGSMPVVASAWCTSTNCSGPADIAVTSLPIVLQLGTTIQLYVTSNGVGNTGIVAFVGGGPPGGTDPADCTTNTWTTQNQNQGACLSPFFNTCVSCNYFPIGTNGSATITFASC